MSRRLIASGACVPLAAALALAVAPPASAGTPITAHAAIGVSYPSPTTFKVCPVGLVDDGTIVVGEWLFELDGTREDGTTIHFEQGGFGASFAPPCVLIDTNGTQVGSFGATLSYLGVGSSANANTNGVDTKTIPDFVALSGVAADWTPTQEANGFGM